MSIVATDLVLPGNAGFDLRVTRIYSSNLYPNYDDDGDTTLEEDSWAGIGWRLHFGRVLNPNSTVGGETSIELGDGSRHALYSTSSYPEGWMSTGFARYDRTNHTLKLPNGYIYTFGHVANLGGSLGAVRYVTEIRDPFDNKIEFDYFAAPGPVDGVSQIRQYLSPTQVRYVNFTYQSGINALATMSYGTRTWTYTHDTIGTAGLSLLRQAKAPLVPATLYDYTASLGELTRIDTPSGGSVSYTYQDASRKAGSLTNLTRVVATRATSGRLVEPGTWTFSYGTGSNEDTTVVACPCNTTRYRFNGTGLSGDFSAWKSGTLAEQTIEKADGTVLERQVFTWIRSAMISPDPVAGEGGVWSDGAVYSALLESTTTTRGSQTWTTTHEYNATNFNDYGQPWRTWEGGEFTRRTDRTFQTSFTPHVLGRVASTWTVVGTEGVGATWEYDLMTGFLTSYIGPGSPRIRYTARTDGNVATTKDDLNNETFFENYTWGQPQRIRTPHLTTDIVVNDDGTVAGTSTGDLGVTYLYDSLFRVKQVTPVGQHSSIYNYDDVNGTGYGIDRGTTWVSYLVDGFGRLVRTTGDTDEKVRAEYDACGRQIFASNVYKTGLGTTGTTTTYDAMGRPTQVTAANGKTTQFGYTGNDITVTDPANQTTMYTYNAAGSPEGGRLASVLDADNQTTTYAYDVLDSLIRVSGPGPIPDRTWTYTALGLVLSSTQPESGTTTFVYDAAGNLTQTTDAKGIVVLRTYDGNNRLTTVDAPGTADDVTYTYDASGRLVSQVTPAPASLTMAYPTVLQYSRTDAFAGGTYVSGYHHDQYGNLTQITYPSGRAVTYEYDAHNRLTTVKQNGAIFADLFTYDDSGRLSSYRTGAVTHTTTYDLVDRPQQITIGSALNLTYAYDDAGNVQQITDTRPGMNQSFGYDALNRLESASGPWGQRGWTYTPSGDRLTETGASSTQYHYDAKRRLSSTTGASSQTFSYDNLGQLEADSRGTFTYNAAGLVTTFTGPNVSASYGYDAAGLRIARTVNGVTHYTIRSATGSVLSEYRATCGTPIWSRDVIYAGGRLLGAVRSTAAQPTVSLTAASHTIGEGAGSVGVTIQLTTADGNPLPCAVTASYAAVPGNAGAGVDFRLASGSVTFAAGSPNGTTSTINPEILSDTLDEVDETFAVTLSGVTGGAAGATTSAVVTITDDDAPPTLSIADTSTTEGNTVGGVLTFAVTLSTASGRTLSIDYATTADTATASSDFVPASGTLEFEPGEFSKLIAVVVQPDLFDEPNEQLFVNLTNPSQVTLADAQAIGTITDDDLDDNMGGLGSGALDIIWKRTDGALAAWQMTGTTRTSRHWLLNNAAPMNVTADWDLGAVLDVTGDGQRDLIWQHRTTMQLVQWHMNQNQYLSAQAFSLQLSPTLPGEPRWFLQAAGDMNGDGHKDLIFRREDGYVATWLLNGGTVIQTLLLHPVQVGMEWRLVAATDLNGDGHTDLLWQRETDGLLTGWKMTGTTWTNQALTVADQAPNTWRVRAVGDLNGDGYADWVWHKDDGHLSTWLMTWDGSAVRIATTGMSPPEAAWIPDITWQIVGRK